MSSIRGFALLLVILGGFLTACGSPESDSSAAFVKANPPVDGVLEYPPRTLRVFLTELPDISQSQVKLNGPDGEIPLVRLHTMGANDLMVEIEQYPLPNGDYTVQWQTRFVDGSEEHSGSYQFTVAAQE